MGNNEHIKNKAVNGVSVVIPLYNEYRTVGVVIDNIKRVMDSSGSKYEIITVDDGSTDKSVQIVKDKKGIIVLENYFNLGYGASLKIGIRHASYDTILIIDADGTYPTEKIPELLRYADKYDMVVAARVGETVEWPILRRMAKALLNKLANYLSGQRIPDLNSGLRVMKKENVMTFLNILPSGFSFTTTITLALLTNNYTVKYVSINYSHGKRKSKFHPIKDTTNMLVLIIRTVLYFNPLKIFLPMSMVIFSFGLILLLCRIFILKAFGITILILFISSFQLLAIGMLADLIDKRIR